MNGKSDNRTFHFDSFKYLCHCVFSKLFSLIFFLLIKRVNFNYLPEKL